MLMMNSSFLSDEERANLRSMHRQIHDRRISDRFKAILLRDKGRKWSEVADDLLLDESTLRRYLEVYKSHGSEGLLWWECSGGNNRKLTEIYRSKN